MRQADAILYTEKMYHAGNIEEVDRSEQFWGVNMRAAHVYNIAFTHVRQNFAIAGLLSEGFLKVCKTTLLSNISL